MRKFAISDIHGCLKSFEALLDRIQFSSSDELYLLGDYIDRGPDSKGVIDLIWKMQADGYAVSCLRGNHEQMLLNLQEQRFHPYDRGDDALLASFDVQHATNIPEKYLDWCRNLPYYFEVDNYLLVHAGLDFSHPDPLQDTYSMLWIRNWRADIDRNWLDGRIVVHGHTPTPRPAVIQYLQAAPFTPEVVIDNGCVYYDRHPDLGALCALELTKAELTFQDYVG